MTALDIFRTVAVAADERTDDDRTGCSISDLSPIIARLRAADELRYCAADQHFGRSVVAIHDGYVGVISSLRLSDR